MTKERPVVQVRHLSKVFVMGEERLTALKDINLDIRPGEIFCIFGPSGSGKSTLLNILAGLERPTTGAVRICGQVITQMNEECLAAFRQKNTGFVFQSYNLLPELTALENVALPLMFQGVPQKKREEEALRMLSAVGLKDRAGHYPAQMSCGQQQRTGIARALVTRPPVLFADEPTGNLDSKTTLEVMEMITRCARTFHQTILLVTHDPAVAGYATRIVHLMDGRIVQDERVTPENHPKRRPDYILA